MVDAGEGEGGGGGSVRGEGEVIDTDGVGDLLSVRDAQFSSRQPLPSHELVYGLDRAKFCRASALTHR